MSFRITYRRLFELHIMHEFFLSQDVDNLYYSLNTNDRSSLLSQKLNAESYDIREYLELIPTEECARMMRRHHMKFIPTALGGYLGIKVTDEPDSFTPFLSLSPDLKFSFHLRIRHHHLNTITQTRFSTPTPAIYYVSNSNTAGNKTFPSLAEPVEDIQAGQNYEMGELARRNNIVATANKYTSNNTDWSDLGIEGYLSEQDRYLLPHQFSWTFPDATGITDVTFRLEEIGNPNPPVKEILFTGITQPHLPFLLDFSQIADPADPLKSLPIANGPYQLSINPNAGNPISMIVHLDDRIFDSRNLGAMELMVEAGDTDFNLLDNGNVRDPHPVFEIRLKNRLTHLRYHKKTPFTNHELTGTADFFAPSSGNELLTTKEPRFLIEGVTIFQKTGVQTLVVPSPSLDFISKDSDFIYADVYVSKANPIIKES